MGNIIAAPLFFITNRKVSVVKHIAKIFVLNFLVATLYGCGQSYQPSQQVDIPAAEIFGNADYPAISYGGYREKTRDTVPTVDELKDDMKILAAMGVKILRTYNASQYPQASRILEAIREIKQADPSFEMYVMLGAWIDCENAWTDFPNHHNEDEDNNSQEIQATVDLANQYPDIVKAIAVGNEAMVQWAVKYFVYPKTILRWVKHLQQLKKAGDLPAGVWITSSDNYESWGGGAKGYHTDDLAALVRAVDFLSVHTYPFHDSHYNPDYWGVLKDEESLSELEMIEAAMLRAKQYAISQYQGVADYVQSLGLEKPIHIGETGWSSVAATAYGASGSKAADELKQALFYQHMRDWEKASGMSVFYFEAFDEQWKDAIDPNGSENHFGLIALSNEVKYALWSSIDSGTFDGLTRNGKPLTKSYAGDLKALMDEVLLPPFKSQMGIKKITTVNAKSKAGEQITADSYVVAHPSMVPTDSNKMTYPSNIIKINAWEGTMDIYMNDDSVLEVVSRIGDWWGGGLELQGDAGENLSGFKAGYLNFDIRGDNTLAFDIGFQTGVFLKGNQINNFISFAPNTKFALTEDWVTYKLPISMLNKGADLQDVTGLLYLRSDIPADKKKLFIKNIYYSKS